MTPLLQVLGWWRDSGGGPSLPRFAANLHYLFNEHPFLDRFAAAADAGFRAVEAQVPYHWPASELARRLEANGLEMALIDTLQGD